MSLFYELAARRDKWQLSQTQVGLYRHLARQTTGADNDKTDDSFSHQGRAGHRYNYSYTDSLTHTLTLTLTHKHTHTHTHTHVYYSHTPHYT